MALDGHLQSLYESAVAFAESRETFSRDRFQRVMRVGFITRDRLLLALVDAGVIEGCGSDHFRVAKKTFSCGRCGDDSEPADCPDLHSFEDHGLCCMGRCLACQHRIDQGEDQ